MHNYPVLVPTGYEILDPKTGAKLPDDYDGIVQDRGGLLRTWVENGVRKFQSVGLATFCLKQRQAVAR